MKQWQENVMLAPYTTMQLGGPARYFASVASVEELIDALREAREKKLRVHILAGGSNTVFSDEGFDGLVVKNDLKGISFMDDGDDVVITAQAGEAWEPLARETVERSLAGFECLAGIPGTVGATPVQNVGAYGQDVSQTIMKVQALDRATLELVEFSNSECNFSYRTSRFKEADVDRYVIVSVTYRLKKNGPPTLVYHQVIETIGDVPTLQKAREVVLMLRKSKSMVLDSSDPHSRSCGSFFTNPILSSEQLEKLILVAADNDWGEVPRFDYGPGAVTVPAAWLIERAGWHKGFRRKGVGISANHPLALVNYGGTAAEIISLATDIQRTVQEKCGISLVREPVIVK